MQNVYSMHVRDLHKTIHFTCKACMVTLLLSFLRCDLSIEYWGVIVNLMYKKASLSDVKKATFDTMASRLQLCYPSLI